MNIGDRIKEKRLELGLTVEQLAKLVGKNRATIYRYESNDIENFPLDLLPLIADALNTTPAYLMGWESSAQGFTLGSVISMYRAEKHLSMDQFAELSGISKAYISMLERNKTPRGDAPSPSYEIYKSVALAVGMSVEQLVALIEANSPAPCVASESEVEPAVSLRLKELRKTHGLHMKAVAEAMGLPYTTYVGYEKGLREPPLRVLRQFSDYYQIPIDDLFMQSASSQTIFNVRLRELRHGAGISQSELANKIGISKSSIAMYERGEREPNLGTLSTIADFFGVTTDYILGRPCDSPRVPPAMELRPDQKAFLDLLSSASPSDLEALLRLAKALADSANSLP